MNGIRLLGRSVFATAVVAATAHKELPASLTVMIPIFSQVSVTSMKHVSDKIRVINMRKGTAVNNKQKQELNPIHMCSSLVWSEDP